MCFIFGQTDMQVIFHQTQRVMSVRRNVEQIKICLIFAAAGANGVSMKSVFPI